MEIRINCKDVKRGTAKRHGNGSHVYVPKEWIGHTVLVLLDPEE